jgi:hypothetical protein
MHQCLIQWDGDEVEVVRADDSIEISHAAMSIWDAEDQEPVSGISLEGCDRMEATKNRVRLVLSVDELQRASCSDALGEADPRDRPQKIKCKLLMPSILHDHSSRLYF